MSDWFSATREAEEAIQGWSEQRKPVIKSLTDDQFGSSVSEVNDLGGFLSLLVVVVVVVLFSFIFPADLAAKQPHWSGCIWLKVNNGEINK